MGEIIVGDYTFSIKIDPLGKYTDADDYYIRNSIGIIPHWTFDIEHIEMPVKEALDKQYGFGLYEMGGKITEDGVYVSEYEEDPDLYPIAKMIRGEETVYCYQYAIVGIVQKDGSSFITRMD